MYRLPRMRPTVRALAGDSTMTKCFCVLVDPLPTVDLATVGLLPLVALGLVDLAAVALALVEALAGICRSRLPQSNIVHATYLFHQPFEFHHGQQAADYRDGQAGASAEIIDMERFLVQMP